MNILEYVKNGGVCKSKSGHFFVLNGIENGAEYPITGYLQMENYKYPCKWTENGVPHNLPYSHGLDLMPVISIVSHKMIDKEILSRYMTVEEFRHDAEILSKDS